MFLYNPEVKKFLSKYVTLMFIVIIISIGFSVINVSLTKDMVVRNNQAIYRNFIKQVSKLRKSDSRHNNSREVYGEHRLWSENIK